MKKTIAGKIIESVIGFDEWCADNKRKFLDKYQEQKIEDDALTQEELDTLESDEYDRRTCHQA